MQSLVIVRGLPGSGKSTFAKRLVDYGFMHLETDAFFMVDGAYVYQPEKIREAHSWCQKEAGKALGEGFSVVVSNTFTMAWEFEPYLELSASYSAVPFILDMDGTWDNVHGVPSNVLQAMKDRFEPTRHPSVIEFESDRVVLSNSTIMLEYPKIE